MLIWPNDSAAAAADGAAPLLLLVRKAFHQYMIKKQTQTLHIKYTYILLCAYVHIQSRLQFLSVIHAYVRHLPCPGLSSALYWR